MPARAQELRLRRIRECLLECLVERAPELPEEREHERDRVQRVVDPVQVGSNEAEAAPGDAALSEDARCARRRSLEGVVEEEEIVLGLVRELERDRDPEPAIARELRQ